MLEMTPCIQQTYNQDGSSGLGIGTNLPSNKRKRITKTIYVPHRNKPANIVSRRNARERRRVQAVNNAFKTLRSYIPYENRNKRLSKVKTLQKVIDYIHHLRGMIEEMDAMHMRQNSHTSTSNSQIVAHPSQENDPHAQGGSVSSCTGYFQHALDNPQCAFYGVEMINSNHTYWNNAQESSHQYQPSWEDQHIAK